MGRRAGTTADETRQQLLAAAVRVFATSGYEGSRVSDIAAEAGLSTGAIYAHYQTKAELLCAAIRAGGPKAIVGLLDAGSAGSVIRTLQALGTRLGSATGLRRGSTKRDILIESLAASRRDPEVAAVLRESIAQREQVMIDLIRRGQESAEIAAGVSVPAVARLCMMLVLGSIVTRAIGLAPPPADQWEAVITSLVHTMQPESSRQPEASR